MSTITGPKITAAGFPRKALIRKLATNCRATRAIEPSNAPRRTTDHGSRVSGSTVYRYMKISQPAPIEITIELTRSSGAIQG